MEKKFAYQILKAMKLNGLSFDRYPKSKEEWTVFLNSLNAYFNLAEEKQKQKNITQVLSESIEIIDVGFIIFDTEKKIIFCNQKYRDFFPQIGHILLPGTNLITLLTEFYMKTESIRNQFSSFKDYIEAKSMLFFGMQVQREETHGDKTYIINDCVLKDGSLISLVTNITDQKKKELDLERREAQFSALIVALPGHVSWIDKDLNYLGVNIGLANQNNLLPEDFIGKKLGFMKNQSHPNITEKVQEFFKSNAPYLQFESSIQTQQGLKYLLVCIKKYSDSGNAVIVSIDITPQKELEQKIEIERQKMISSSKMSALGEMAAGLGHEINNPLTIISTKAQMIKVLLSEGKLDDGYVNNTADTIIKTAERISKIIRGLKVLARKGEDDPLIPVSIKTILDETLAFCQARLTSHNIQLKLQPISEDLKINCRSVQISQVILNLINNAHDAILSDTEEKWVKIDVSEKESLVEISITDSGKEIPKETKEKLFQPFFTTKEVGKGTGLGLSISLGILKSQHGNIYLDSQSKNTRFVIEIPKVEVMPSNTSSHSAA